jgi:hypothetical protein
VWPAFPSQMPRRVRHVVLAGLCLCDDVGEVRGGMAALHGLLGNCSSSGTRQAVRDAEGWGWMRRKGGALFVVVARLNPAGSCETGCGRPSVAAAGGQGPLRHQWRWCAVCRQAMRHDRRWGRQAVEMLVAGKSPMLIGAALHQPVFPTEDSHGVLIELLQEAPHLVDDEWREALRLHSPELAGTGKLTQRAKDRRLARRAAP